MAFHPSSVDSLIVVLSKDNSFLIYDVSDKSLTPWSRDNVGNIPNWSEGLNRSTVGPIYNVTFDPSSVTSFVLSGQGFSVCIDLDEKIPAASVGASSEGKLVAPVPIDSPQDVMGAGRYPLNKRDKKKRKQMEKEEAAAATGTDRATKTRRSNRNFRVIKMRSVVQLAVLGRQEMVSERVGVL